MAWDILDPRCGQPFIRWRADDKPLKSDVIELRHFVHLDGRPIQPGEPLACDSCGRGIDSLSLLSPFTHPERWVPARAPAEVEG